MHYNIKPNKLPNGITTWFELEKKEFKSKKYLEMKKIVISDCDGILTDSKSIYGKEGKLYKTYGAYDKEAMEVLAQYGWEFYFVSDDKAGIDITFSRLEHLKNSFNGCVGYGNISREERIKLIEGYISKGYCVLFIGDSLSDIASMNIATYAGCTNNAPSIVKSYCHFISNQNGSEGGFADILLYTHKVLKEI